MMQPDTVLFLPGASGDVSYWKPVATRLTTSAHKELHTYPGFGGSPCAAGVENLNDLVTHLTNRIKKPTAIVAQSMGCVLAIKAALEKPELITHLVIVAMSGGLRMRNFGAVDWRRIYRRSFPGNPDWFMTFEDDLSGQLAQMSRPTLIICGKDDPYCPVSVGHEVLSLVPNSDLTIISGAGHYLASSHARKVSSLIEAHIARISIAG
jgi:poly(3-hydroxyoctanoate) depolymerase